MFSKFPFVQHLSCRSNFPHYPARSSVTRSSGIVVTQLSATIFLWHIRCKSTVLQTKALYSPIHLRAQTIRCQHAVTDDRATSTSRPVPVALLSAPAELLLSWGRRCHVYRQSRCITGQSQLSPLLIHSIAFHCPAECRQHSTCWYE